MNLRIFKQILILLLGSFSLIFGQHSISGNAGVVGVSIDTNGVFVTSSGASGNYLITVPTGFSGTVTPTKTGYTFTPANRVHNNVITDLTNQDFSGALNQQTISGNTGVGLVDLAWTGGAGTTSLANGNYTITVDYDWSGTISPTKTGYTFTPANRVHNNVITNLTNQDFSGALNQQTISGNTGVGLVDLAWTGGAGTTSLANGNYTITVDYDWSGTISPTKTGYTFTPANRVHNNVITNLTNQDFSGALNQQTISGNTGIGLVDLAWTGGAGTTSLANGNYTITVDYDWSGTISPTKTGYTFTPANRVHNNVITNLTNQDFSGALNQQTISGNTGIGLVDLAWTGGAGTTSLANGNYTITVDYDWSGTITPTKTGYTFTPTNRVHNNVITDLTNQDFSGALNQQTISGNTGVGLVDLAWTGGAGTTSLANGNYTITVDYDWSGTITPTKTGYTFTPTNRVHNNVITDLTNQDFSGALNQQTISGNTGVGLVDLAWTGGAGTTSLANGNYTITVDYDWSGTITPTKTGYTFTPTNRVHNNVITDLTNQDFSGALNQQTISGNTGVGLVDLAWTGGAGTTSLANGNYTITVDYDWSGTITPTKTGYTFTPTNRVHSNVITNLTNQDFSGALNQQTISGNTGVGLVDLAWTGGPGTTSLANGNYTITVDYDWSGTITPTKIGYTFTPTNRVHNNVITDLTNQDFSGALNQQTISGNTGVGLVDLAWTGGSGTTSLPNGNYTITVDYNWSGTITPTKTGYSFTPANRDHNNIITDLTNQNFSATLNSYTIEGNTGVGGVLLSWVDGTVKTFTSADNGDYTIAIEYGWSGTVTPTKIGYSFLPLSRNYIKVAASALNENYSATLNTYTLTTIVNPGSSGTISGSGIYSFGSTAIIEATPAVGYSFLNWSGDITSSDNPENILIDDNKEVTANFLLNSYIITSDSNPPAGGTSSGGATYSHGDQVTLVAISATGYNFVNWTLNGSPVSLDSTFIFTAQDAGAYLANFIKKKYTVTTNPTPPEGGTILGDGKYEHGTLVNIIATPNIGWKFENWSEGRLILSSDSSYSFVLLDHRNINGNFSKKIYSLTTNSLPSEAGTTSGDGNYEHGTSVTIVANPNVGWKFVNWTEGSTEVYTDSLSSFELTESRTITANYIKKEYSIIANSSPSLGGETLGDSIYTHGDLVTLTAVAEHDSGYEFVSWTENGSLLTTDSVYSFSATSARSLVANFKLRTYSVALEVNPIDAGSPTGFGVYTHGDSVTITANPAPGWLFANWTEDSQILSSDSIYTFKIKNNHLITANLAHQLYNIKGTPLPLIAGFVSGAGAAFYDQFVVLTASPNIGWEFKRWQEGETILSIVPILEFNVTDHREIVAIFAPKIYSIIGSAEPFEAGFTNGWGLSNYGQSMTVRAVPNDGYKFLKWTENGNIVSEEVDYTFLVERNRNLVAVFDFSTDLEKLDNMDIIPENYYLSNAYPNPFNPETNIQFGLPEPSETSIKIYDVNGQLVSTLLDQVALPSGNYLKKFKAINFTSGIYFYRIFAHATGSDKSFVKVGKLVFVK